MVDGITIYAVAARYVVAARHPLVSDDRQVVRVRGVVPPDNDHDVQWVLEEPEEGVLPILGRRADGVEELEVLLDVLGPVALGHRLPELLAHGQRLAHEHRGLVGDANAPEVLLGIEAGRHAVRELICELFSPHLAEDEVRDVARLFEVAQDQVLPVAAIPQGLRGGGLGLFVVVLAVDDACKTALGVARDALPHGQHRPAGRVYHDALLLLELLDPVYRGAESGQEHDVVGGEIFEGFFGGTFEASGEELYPHLAQAVVHGGVVDHVPGNIDSPVGELLPGLEGVVYGPVHPVAEPELVGEADREVLDLEDVAVLTHPVDYLRAIVPVQKMLDVLPHLEAFTEIFLLRHAHLSYPTFVSRARS